MRIRLTRKYADLIDGVDLSKCKVGDVVDLPDREAELLIAEGWAAAKSRNSRGAAANDTAHRPGAIERKPQRDRSRNRRS